MFKAAGLPSAVNCRPILFHAFSNPLYTALAISEFSILFWIWTLSQVPLSGCARQGCF
jgi:hypothetical protein